MKLEGHNRFRFAGWLFLRVLALIHLTAHVSFWVQLDGLVGPHGLSPATTYFAAAREQLGSSVYLQLPSLCWLFGTATFLPVLCAAGVACSLLLFANVAPAVCLALLWASYLSLCAAGQLFFNFQWDSLLLETTLLAVFLAPRPAWRGCGRWLRPAWWRGRGEPILPPEPARLARLLLWWLLFRLMFLSGVVKLASGDDLWRNLTALTVHFETQPLPTPLAWYAHQLPDWWHRVSCAGMFAVELAVPFFLFAPRRLRHLAALLLAVFMAGVALSGNYTYFNVLAIALCLLCLDDAWWRSLPFLGRRIAAGRARANPATADLANAPDPGGTARSGAPADRDLAPAAATAAEVIPNNHRPWRNAFAATLAALVLAYTTVQALPTVFRGLGPPPGMNSLVTALAPFRSLNTYGLFAVMTHPRPELIFEGSDDGRAWHAYEFPHKPGSLARRPTWVAPHQPRLDWQLWFAALGTSQHNRWVLGLCEHLLRGTPHVLALLDHNPFPNAPPRHIRVVRYEYRFTDAATRRQTAQWWHRTPLDFYVPPSSLGLR